MKIKNLFVIAFAIIISSISFAQVSFKDLPFDSTATVKDANDHIEKIDHFYHGELVMQKFYPKENYVDGLCHRYGPDHDSVIIHFSKTCFVAKFEKGNKTIVNSWEKLGNVVTTQMINEKGEIIKEFQKVKRFESSSPYPVCWLEGYFIGEYKNLVDSKLKVSTNYDSGSKFSKGEDVPLNDKFLKLKKEAENILKKYYGSGFTKNHIKFNLSKSCYYSKQQVSRRYKNKAPSHGNGISLIKYNNQHEVFYVDMAFDIQFNDYRFNCISIRFDENGDILYQPVQLWKKVRNSTFGFVPKKSEIISPEECLKIANKNSKWPLSGNVSVNLVWEPKNESDSVGSIFYIVDYDHFIKSYGSTYTRQIKINAITMKFVSEKEGSYVTSGIGGPNQRFYFSGKYGFKSFNKVLIEAMYEELPEYFSNFMIAKKNGKYGVITKKNEVLIDFKYDKIKYHKSKFKRYGGWFVIVTQNGKKGLYEKKKGIVLEPNYISFLENDKEQLEAVTEEGTKVIYDMRTGQVIN